MTRNIPSRRTALSAAAVVALSGFAAVGSGCNNAGQGAFTGAGLGAAGGAIIGSLYGHAGRGAAIGAVSGAVAGGVLGDQNDRRSTTRYYYDGRGGYCH